MFTHIRLLLVVLLGFSFPAWAKEDYLLENTMDGVEFEAFKERVGIAVANHPEFRSSQASLRAAYAQIKGSKSSLLPQISVILDSNNAISRKYANDSSNLVERSQSDHKTNVRFSINQLLYDFGATRYEVSRSESLAKASRAELSQTILELLYFSIRSYIDVASYATYEKVVEESYLRHQSIKKGIEQRVQSGMAAGRDLSRAEAREAEAFAKLVSVKQNLGVSISKFRIYFPEGDLPTKLPSYPYDISKINLASSKLIMLKKNPNVLQANQEFSASTFKTKSANASSKPRLDFEIRKNHYDVTKESDEFDTFSGVNFSYDLYTGGRDEAFKEQSQAEEDAALNSRDALLQRLVAELKQSVRNLKLLPDRLDAYKNAYTANKKSQYFAQEEFRSSNAVLLDLLQTERDYLDASESLIETLRSSEIEKYSYLQLTGELGETFEVIIN